MDFKINYSSKLINTNFNIKTIIAEKYLLEKTNTLYKNILPDWNIVLNVIYSSSIYDSNIISISKKGITYSKDLEKHIGINIPIPLKSEQSWGIDKKNVSYQPFYDREKYNYLLEFDFSKFQNIEDYKNAAIIRGIDELFRLGFTLQKKKNTNSRKQRLNPALRRILKNCCAFYDKKQQKALKFFKMQIYKY
jgi:hypothetical protein